jgi:hypothetical protein
LKISIIWVNKFVKVMVEIFFAEVSSNADFIWNLPWKSKTQMISAPEWSHRWAFSFGWVQNQ